MSVSYAEQVSLSCPECGRPVSAEVWLIVDAAERPDLLERLREGELNRAVCSGCGHRGEVDAPLLLYRPDADPPLLFSPARRTSAEEDRAHAAGLLARLREALGEAWREEWGQGVPAVPREMLPIVLGDDPEGALRQLTAALQQFLQADTWADSRRVLEAHPELLSDATEALLEGWIRAARAQGDEEAWRSLERRRELLRRCREVGVEEAFAEWTEAGDRQDPAVARLLDEAGDLGRQLAECLRVRSPEEHRAYLEAHSDLYGPEGLALLERLLAAETDAQRRRKLAFFLQIHRRCREVGVEEAFAELMRAERREGPPIPPPFREDLRRIQEAMHRYLQTGAEDALDVVLSAWERILRHPAFLEADLRFRLAAWNDAGGVYLRRYWRRGDPSDLNSALKLWKRAVELTPEGSPDLPGFLNNLALGLRARYGRTGQLEDLQEAIGHWKRAVELTPEGSPDLPSILNNLASGLRARYGRTGQLEDLQEAIGHWKRAVERGLEVAREEALRAARNWGHFSFSRNAWSQAVQAYGQAYRAMDRLLRAQVRRAGKETWLREAQALPARYAYALARLGRRREAVEVLEQGRAQLLREALERNRRDLERLPELGFGHLLERYRQAQDRLEALQRQAAEAGQPGAAAGRPPLDYGSWWEAVRAAQRELDAAVEAIRREAGRTHPEYRTFLRPPSFAEIQAQAVPAPLVYLLATPAGGLALIVRGSGEPEAVELPDLTEEALRKHVEAYFRAYFDHRNLRRDPSSRAAWFDALDGMLAWLAQTVMGPLMTHLQTLGYPPGARVCLIPTGRLGLLPLHAAWTEDPARPGRRRYALDRFCFTYAPSAHALARHRGAADRPADSLLAVDNPDGTLRFSAHEVRAILDTFERSTPLSGAQATREAVLAQMPRHAVVHFSTHGRAGWTEAAAARLELADGPLTLDAIYDLDLRETRLAVLSACETGVPGTRLPEEVESLPSGLLQAGVPGVVGSLWTVNDLSTAMLMARFYELWRRRGFPAPEALRQAQIWLRDLFFDEASLAELEAQAAPVGVRLDPEQAEQFLKTALLREFSHPFYWAAFTYTGW